MSSVSLEPPLVMVALARKRFITPIVSANGRFAVNVLRLDQQAGAPRHPKQLADRPAAAADAGAPAIGTGHAAVPLVTALPLLSNAVQVTMRVGSEGSTALVLVRSSRYTAVVNESARETSHFAPTS